MIRAATLACLLAAPAAAEPTAYRATITRVLDADTMEATLYLDGLRQEVTGLRLRLACVDAPESGTPEGEAMTAAVTALLGAEAVVVLAGDGGFGRVLAWVTPGGWDETLNRRLYRSGAPLYEGLSAAKRGACEKALK